MKKAKRIQIRVQNGDGISGAAHLVINGKNQTILKLSMGKPHTGCRIASRQNSGNDEQIIDSMSWTQTDNEIGE
jgi:hypothetical protein